MNKAKMFNHIPLLSFSKIVLHGFLFILIIFSFTNAQEKHSNAKQWKSVGGKIIVSGTHNFTNSLSIKKGKITVKGPGFIAKFVRGIKSSAVGAGLKTTEFDIDFITAYLGEQNLLYDSQGNWNWYDRDIQDFDPTIHNGGWVPADNVITLDLWAYSQSGNAPVGVEYEFWFFPREGGKIIKVIKYGPNGEEIDVTPGKTAKDKIAGNAGRIIKGKVFDVATGRYLKPGDRVSIDQFLETHDNEANIIIDYLGTETTIKMKKKTKIKIVKRIKKTKSSGVSLVFGRLWSLFNNRHKGEYAVETFNSVAGVEGTEFETAYDPVTGKTTIAVWEGVVSLKCKNNNAPPMRVNAGMQATMDNNCNHTLSILSSDNNTSAKAGWDVNISPDFSNAVGTAKLLTASSNRDIVGRNEKFHGNGKTDAIFRAQFSASNRTVTAVEVSNTNGLRSVWDTRPNNRLWLGAVVIQDKTMSRSDGSVNFSLGSGQNIMDYYVEDNGSISGWKTNYRMTIFFASGDPLVMNIIPGGGSSEIGQQGKLDHAVIIDKNNSHPWVIGTDNGIHYGTKSGWVQQPGGGLGKDIAIDGNGRPWVIGTDQRIYYHDGNRWIQYPGGGKGLAVDVSSDGTPWVIGTDQRIYYHDGNRWIQYPGGGKGIDIDVSSDGTPWVIGTDNGIYYHDGNKWVQYPGGGRGSRIAISPNGTPWVIGSDNRTHYGTGSGWVQQPGEILAKDITIDESGRPWVIGTDQRIYYHDGNRWIEYPGSGRGLTIAISTNK